MLFNARAEAPSPPEPWIDRCAIGFVDGCMEQVADAFAGTAPAFHRVGAAKLFANECADDDADSCAILGLLYVHGFGVEPDLRHAAMLFDHACIEQVAWACAESARLSTEAEGGVPRNDAKAATLNRWACSAGVGQGCTQLAASSGSDVAARALYERGCALHHWFGCVRAGQLDAKECDWDPACLSRKIGKR